MGVIIFLLFLVWVPYYVVQAIRTDISTTRWKKRLAERDAVMRAAYAKLSSVYHY